MSLTNIEQVMPVKLAQALANPLFPALDSALRSGRHIGLDELDNHAFLMDFQEYLEEFYARYNVELIRAPEGFFYLRPRSTTLIPRSVLSELDMMVGKFSATSILARSVWPTKGSLLSKSYTTSCLPLRTKPNC
ncbi:condesin subunit E [Salmonella enterica subsp. enterica serovar Newport str. VA_R100512570]|nr:condesin subunit E [Salmonella enterica subsp. enterica serovar Newport str. VA_R100512570]